MAGETTAQFGVTVRDGVSGSADAAAHALRRLRSAIDEDKSALAQMQSAMRALQSSGTVNIATFRELQGRIEAQKQKIGEATSKYVQLGGSFGKVKKDAGNAKGGLASILDQVKGAPGPLGRMAASLGQMTEMLPAVAAAAGLAAMSAAFVALGVAIAGATVKLIQFGLASAAERREERGRLEGLTLMRNRTGQAADAVDGLQNALSRVSSKTSASRGELEGMQATLYRMGLRGRSLETALEGAAMSSEVLGERGAARFMQMARAARHTQGGIDALAERTRTRLGPAAARMMLDWNVQVEKFRENLTTLFEDINLDPVLKVVQSITALFSQNTVMGYEMKRMFERMFGPLGAGASRVGPMIVNMFKRAMIVALDFEGALYTLRNAYYDALGGPATYPLVSGLTDVLLDAINPLNLVSHLLEQAGSGAMFFANGLASIMGPTGRFLAGLHAITGVVRRNFDPERWRTLGSSVVDGLVNGITNGIGRVVTAVSNLGGSAKRALMEALQIHSPSRVFAELGRQIPRGLAIGVEAGDAEVEESVRTMVGIPGANGADGESPSGARAGGAMLSIGELHIHAQSSDPEALAASFAEKVAELLEGVVIQMGARA